MSARVVTTLPVLVAIAFWAYCLVDFAHTPESAMRTYSKQVWIVLLVFLNIVGGALWLAVGRPLRR